MSDKCAFLSNYIFMFRFIPVTYVLKSVPHPRQELTDAEEIVMNPNKGEISAHFLFHVCALSVVVSCTVLSLGPTPLSTSGRWSLSLFSHTKLVIRIYDSALCHDGNVFSQGAEFMPARTRRPCGVFPQRFPCVFFVLHSQTFQLFNESRLHSLWYLGAGVSSYLLSCAFQSSFILTVCFNCVFSGHQSSSFFLKKEQWISEKCLSISWIVQQTIKLHWFKLIGVCCPRTQIRKYISTTLPCFIFQIETPSATLGPFCGHTPPPSPLLTHSHNVQVRFTSDGYGTNKGFSLRFRVRGAEMHTPVTQTGNQLLLMNLVCCRLQSVLTLLFFTFKLQRRFVRQWWRRTPAPALRNQNIIRVRLWQSNVMLAMLSIQWVCSVIMHSISWRLVVINAKFCLAICVVLFE